jgi:hypothetical protein
MARYRRRSYRRRRHFKRQKGVSAVGPRREHICHQQLSTAMQAPFNSGESLLNGPTYVSSTTEARSWAGIWYFDISGSFAMPSGPQTPGANATNAPLTTQNWARFAAIYEMYKVTRIHLKFTYTGTGNADFGAPILYINREFEYSSATPTLADTSIQSGWLRKEFDSNSDNFEYSFTPRVYEYLDNRGTTTVDGRGSMRMPWININTPLEMMGVKVMVWMPVHSNVSYISCQITYNVKFRNKSV